MPELNQFQIQYKPHSTKGYLAFDYGEAFVKSSIATNDYFHYGFICG